MKRRKIFRLAPLILLMITFILTSCGQQRIMTMEQPSSQPSLAWSSSSRSKNYAADMQFSERADGITPTVDDDFNTEEYNKIKERGFVAASKEPLSTFSIDVDTASYSNVRRFLQNGQQVPQDAVRIEEMINYFRYDYPKPEGEVPFSAHTEISDCPWNEKSKLLLIGLQGKEIDVSEMPSNNLVFLIDVSGSMYDYNKLPLVKKALIMLVENLRPEDRISIVTYAGNDSVVLEGVSGEEKLKITEEIENLEAGGSTAGARGIETAYMIAKENFIKEGNNRVILTTDGDFNVGVSSEGELTRLIEKKRGEGIYLSVLGFGQGNIKDNKMEALADNGNGNYAYIDSVLEAKKVLVEEMGGTLLTIAKDVKIQVEFNPEKIKEYRLVGYENRMLNNEDFEDDTKDAGEIGAGHRVTALYEIIPVSEGDTIETNDLKYQTSILKGSEEWLTVQIRYKNPEEETSKLLTYPVDESHIKNQMSGDFAFASAVAEFGLLLRDSQYKGNSSFENVYGRIVNILGLKDDPYKAEFLDMVKDLMKDGK
ncbi:MAG: vWA domain-containing protein [Acetivibrionales bacterium]|jgi:Ca-activated chloride channel family protein